MAEPSKSPVVGLGPMPLTETAVHEYQPVSGWAIASLLVAGLYTLIVGVGGGIALFTFSPYLLPMWTLLLPAVGLALALYAQLHIRQSLGTRAGAGLARISWWLCLLLSVVYISFYGATFMAVRLQADNSVHEWFGLVRAGKVNEAFLRTVRPEQRQNVSPEDENLLRARFDVAVMSARGGLSSFRSSELVHLIQQGGQESQLEALGVQDWQFTEGGYRVARLYKITTPEGEVEVVFITVSAESKARVYEGRQWHVYFDHSTVASARLTPYGQRLAGLRAQGFQFADAWKNKILFGDAKDLESTYLDTQLADKRDAQRAAYQAGKLELKGIVDRDSARSDDKDWRAAATAALDGLFRPRTDDGMQFQVLRVLPVGSRRWEQSQGRIRFTYDGEAQFGPGRTTRHRAELMLVVESEPGAVESGQATGWRLARIELAQTPEPKPIAAGP